MRGERQFWGDCRDDANFGKPFTDDELTRIRALQAARMRFATGPLPLHSSTGADGRWLSTVDALSARVEALTADRDALAALLKEARVILDADGAQNAIALVARIDAASGR